MSLASLRTSLPENKTKPDACGASLDHVDAPQKGEICESIRDTKDISRIGRFTIRPCPQSIYDKPYTFQPLRIIRRSQLPLSFLDTSTASSLVPTSRLFSTSLPLLEEQNQDGRDALLDPQVLLARLDADNTLYAIEMVQKDICALCKLVNWVKPEIFNNANAANVPRTISRILSGPGKENGGKAWAPVALPDSNKPEDVAERPSKKLKASLLPLTAAQGPSNAQVNKKAAKVYNQDESKSKKNNERPVEGQAQLQNSSEVVFATLAKQYLETVYWSKTSLAFFAKGPLSRARAAFTASSNSNMQIAELTTFLRTMILDVKSMDKKYRDKLPAMIVSFPPGSLSEDDEAPPTISNRRKSKKPKLNKDGVYPFEDGYVKRWWTAVDTGHSRAQEHETAQELLKRRLAELRSRETFAQIILILEVMALEASIGTPKDVNAPHEGVDQSQAEGLAERKKPRKRVQNLNLLLDLLVDKLSIWQSIEQDERILYKAKTQSCALFSDKPVDQDLLGTFCTDVIVPFYKSRLPVKATETIKKLSGQNDFSPEKKTNTKTPKPGEPIPKRKLPQNDRRKLQKIASDTQTPRRPPSLLRSATDTLIKRETSETPLSAIPHLKDSRPPSRSRQPSAQLQHLNRRQVDLNTISAAADAKLKRKATIEEELKEAITTLKKPNRGLAIKEFVEASEQRTFASKRKKDVAERRVLQSVRNVQVLATPKHERKIDALAPRDAMESQTKEPVPVDPPSSGEFIPASVMKPSTRNSQSWNKTTRIPPSTACSVIAETPSRGPAKTVSFVGTAAVASTPQRSAQAVSSFRIPSSAVKSMDRVAGIPQTPSKDCINRSMTATTVATKTPSKMNEDQRESIYDTLGWNDDVDELA